MDFEFFVADSEPKLRRAYLGTLGANRTPDAVAEALAFAWEEWTMVSSMSNPVGYLYRVGKSRTRPRKPPALPSAVYTSDQSLFEPGLPRAVMALSDTQRTAVWLAHGCGWSHQEIAGVLDVSTSTVSTHVNRALNRLRTELGVHNDA